MHVPSLQENSKEWHGGEGDISTVNGGDSEDDGGKMGLRTEYELDAGEK